MRPTLPALLAAILLVSPVAMGATTLINEITNATADEEHAFLNFDAPASAVADFDKDGKPEIVAHNDNQYVYVLSTTRADVLAEFRPPYPSSWGARAINDPEVADVDGDGNLDIIVVNSAGVVCDYEYGAGWTFTKRWCKTMNLHDSPGADAGPAVGDVNGDGKMESFSQVEKRGLYAFNWDGTIRWSKAEYGGNSGPLLTDIDGDGKKDVIFFSDGGTVRAYDASSGAAKWVFYGKTYVDPASIPVAGNAADIDNDGKKEIVFTARDAPDSDTNFYDNHLMIFVLSHTGSLQKRWQPSWGHPLSYTHPVLVDVNGDGVRDILLQDWNTIGHKPGDWERLGDAHVAAFKHDGTQLWMTTLANSWSNDDLVVADVDGDSSYEVLAIGYNGGNDGVWYLDLRTGAKEQHVAVGSSWQALRGPIAGNFDESGKTSWAISLAKQGSSEGGWKVFRTDATCKVAFGGWANHFNCSGGSDGGGDPPPPPPPPPPTGNFTFTHGGGNEWWVEAKVDPKPESVQAMDTGGNWVTLAFKDWGEWAGSFRIEAGHDVKFRALSGGTWRESCWFSHPDGAPECSGGNTTPPPPPPPPPPPTGNFTFTHGGGNEWWVEAKVDPKPESVQAMDTGGNWVTLAFKDWGEWAGSFRIEAGHDVKFRALSGGVWHESCWFSHPAGVAECSGGNTTTPPPPTNGTFTATFSDVRGNEWWVETDVATSGGTLAGVDARVNGGAWTALDPKSWGSWAKSIHAPPGSQVEFRARATDGQTSQSSAYTWPPS